MKRTVSMSELCEYCAKNQPERIWYLSENQEWYAVADPCKVKLSFSAITVYENPNVVYLKSGVHKMCLDQVKYAVIDTEELVVGTVLTVFCGDVDSVEGEITYTLLLD